MKKNNYSFGLKAVIAILQGVCVGIIAAALLVISYWLDGTYQFSQLGRSFEETAVFLRDAEDIIRRKIDCGIDVGLFQTNGVTDLNKEIDIRQYTAGIDDEANRNLNLTYHLSDLINYYVGAEAMSEIVNLAVEQEENTPSAPSDNWERLAKAASSVETILPLSGKTLAETARASQTPYETLLEYYRNLIRTSLDLHERYRQYTEEMEHPEGSSNPDAPGNIYYYVENTSTKRIYTNIGATSVATARAAIEEDPDLTFLFGGVRTMEIMVANPDMVLNQEAETKFIDTCFLGSNERVVIAVNRDYPAGDELRTDYLAYQKRKPIVTWSLVCGITAFVSLLILLSLSILTTGRSSHSTMLPLTGFDLLPTEISTGLCLVGGLSWYYLARIIKNHLIRPSYEGIWKVFVVAVLYEIILLSVLSLIRRYRQGVLWSSSVICMIVRVSSQVLEARAASTRMLILYTLFILLNFLFLRFFGTVGVVSVIVMDFALLLYLVRDRLGKLSVREGLRELSKGRLSYKIDTSSLTGDSLEMAEAVNEMGDGLQEAVDSLVNSERMKAELITNVSHDLKTPLTSIINYVDLLKREDLQNEKAREYIDILERKSLRLKSLISDLIDVSRISSGSVELDMKPLDLRAMVQMAAGEFDDRFAMTGLQTKIDGPRREFPVTADGSMLWRVLDNLLGNIAKYAKPNTIVHISLSEEDGRAVCIFENESAETLTQSGPQLQERFVRGDQSRSSEGSGLGLSIARSLTELMGGAMTVETTEHSFSAGLYFPLRKEEPAQP